MLLLQIYKSTLAFVIKCVNFFCLKCRIKTTKRFKSNDEAFRNE